MKKIGIGFAAGMVTLMVMGALIKYTGSFTGLDSGLTNSVGVHPWHPGESASGAALSGVTAANFPSTLASLTVTNLFVQPTNAPGSTWVAAFNTNNGDLVLPAGTAGINAHLLIESNLIVMGGIISSNVTTNTTGTLIKGQFPISINGSTFYIDLKQ